MRPSGLDEVARDRQAEAGAGPLAGHLSNFSKTLQMLGGMRRVASTQDLSSPSPSVMGP